MSFSSYTLHKKDHNIISYAIELSKKSNMQNKHGSVIVDKKGNIISSGYNKIMFVSKDKLGVYCKKTPVKISKHAEEMALKKADPKKLNGAKLYIIRCCYDNDNITLKNSKPCHRCTSIIESCIKKFGLKVVYYSQ